MFYSNHFTAVHPNAQIGSNPTILPFTYIEEDVVIGDNCWVGSNVSIHNGARIGDNCKIFPGASVSSVPQDKKYRGEITHLYLGNGSTVRECCTLNKGTAAAWKTVIGEECLLMAYTHIAHDCVVGNHCVLANNATLAGHIEIEDYAILGGLTAVHQFVRIGESAMVGGGSLVRKDVPPFVTVSREPLVYEGINSIGLERRGFSEADREQVKAVYRILFQRGLTLANALDAIENELENSHLRQQILDFVRLSIADRPNARGLISNHRNAAAKVFQNGHIGQLNGTHAATVAAN